MNDMITAIVPARDEETVIAACVESLAKQPEIAEILVVNDQSRDRTAAVVRQLAARFPGLQLLEAQEPPQGWVGKNNSLMLGARRADSDWLLFVDADELLVYRGWPDRQLIELADEAAVENCNTFFGVLVDMYPNGSLEDAVVSEQGDLFDVAPCFDRDYHFRIRPLTPWEPPEKKLELIGGPRVRMLSSLERELATTWLSRIVGRR